MFGTQRALVEQQPSGFRIAAAALAFAPLGFVGGAVLGAHLNADVLAGADFVDKNAAAAAGAAMLGHGLFGALAAALTAAGVAATLPAKPVRIATLVAGGASFAVVFYLVANFAARRMAAAEAADVAYEAMPPFEFTLASDDARRVPLSSLGFNSRSRDYTARRPGGWLCRGRASRQDTVAMFLALPVVPQPVGDGTHAQTGKERAPDSASDCPLRATWRIADGDERAACIDDSVPLAVAADAMVDATERKASCRRERE